MMEKQGEDNQKMEKQGEERQTDGLVKGHRKSQNRMEYCRIEWNSVEQNRM